MKIIFKRKSYIKLSTYTNISKSPFSCAELTQEIDLSDVKNYKYNIKLHSS